MCGIVGGIFKKEEVVEKLEKYWTLLHHRGFHSYGILLLSSSSWRIIKAIESEDVIKMLGEFVKKCKSSEIFMIAHNRWATTGNILDLKYAHPVISGSWIMVHNGTNHQILNFVKDTQHDTRAIANLLDIINLEEDKLEKANSYFFRSIGVFFAFNPHKHLLIMHRDKTRSLFWNPELKIFASEPVEDGTWYLVPQGIRSIEIKSKGMVKHISNNLNKLLLGDVENPHKIDVNGIRVTICERCEYIRIITHNNRCAYCNVVIEAKKKKKKEKKETKKKKETQKRSESKNKLNTITTNTTHS